MQDRRMLVANPHGFCAGVWRAIECVETALVKYGPPVHCLHEIMHNRQVVERLAAEGSVFVLEVLYALGLTQWIPIMAGKEKMRFPPERTAGSALT